MDHCRSPGCQLNYGHCDASRTPEGPSTSNLPRPPIGKVPYGTEVIRTCTVPGTVALTFDDGPDRYTSELLDLLDKYKARATFFVTGVANSKGQIDDPLLPWPKLIQRMLLSGHQVASHTWSHEDMIQLSPEQRYDQILKNEAALRNVIGAFPTYLRPPYSSCDVASGCLQHLSQLGYHITTYNIDTRDWRNDDPNAIQKSKDIFDKSLSAAKASGKLSIVISHDVHEQTVRNLTEHMLNRVIDNGFRPVTVGECLGDPSEYWYRRDSRVPGFEIGPDKNKTITSDGTCGVNTTCIGSKFGSCCSATNLCGDSDDHCGIGCQANAGHCAPIHVTPIIGDPSIPRDNVEKPGINTSEPEDGNSTSNAASTLNETSVGIGSMVLVLTMTLLLLFTELF